MVHVSPWAPEVLREPDHLTMNDTAATNNRRIRRSAFTGPAARPAAIVRQRRVQLAFDSATGDYRLAMV